MEFLEEMFALRMAVEEEDPQALERARALHGEVTAEIESLFSAWETGRSDLAAIPEALARLQYLASLLEAAK